MDGETNINNDTNNSNSNAQNTTGQNNEANQPNNNSNNIDYNKIQEMIDGRNAKTEDSILKSYFQKQGLSAEEMESAINTFKSQKQEKNQNQTQDNVKMQEQLVKEQQKANENLIKAEAFLLATDLNVDVKTVPYLLKMADTSNCIDKDGNVNQDNLKAALNKVLDDIPGLKRTKQGTPGVKIGADTDDNSSNSNKGFNFNFTGVRSKK